MPEYKIGSVIFEALKMTDNLTDLIKLASILVKPNGTFEHYHKDVDGKWKVDCCGNEIALPIKTTTGKVIALPSDWVIKNKTTGELGVVDAVTFARNYKAI